MSDNKKHVTDWLAAALFKFSFLFLVFVLGGIFAWLQLQPFPFLYQGAVATLTLYDEISAERPPLLGRIHYQGNGVIAHKPGEAYQGYTVLQGSMPGGTQIRLIDMRGELVQQWPVDFFDLWPEPTHLSEAQIPKTPFNYHTQGMVIEPDGSVVFNIAEKGTAKLDKCGEVVWLLDRKTHHSITPTEAGYWIPAHKPIDETEEHLFFKPGTKSKAKRIQHHAFHGYENLVLLVDHNGEVIREFSVLQSLYDAGLESALFDAAAIRKTDPTHINDIVEVTPPLAEKLPGVEIGDLLISIRQLHMLAIFDQYTGELKWHHRGQWVRQHDPEIDSDGNITLFNNSHRHFAFNREPGSNIIKFIPETGEEVVIYPLEDQPTFFSSIMGRHEPLDNGNRLIIESKRGRVFEINEQGDIVWDYILPYDDEYASLIAEAYRLEESFFEVDNWHCPQQETNHL